MKILKKNGLSQQPQRSYFHPPAGLSETSSRQRAGGSDRFILTSDVDSGFPHQTGATAGRLGGIGAPRSESSWGKCRYAWRQQVANAYLKIWG